MAFRGLGVLLVLLFVIGAGADDAKRDDDRAPKSESCNNPFQLVFIHLFPFPIRSIFDLLFSFGVQVKVESWVDGEEGHVHNGVSARFGSVLPDKPDKSVRTPAIFANPIDCCSNSTSKLSGSVALCVRGGCDFTVKAYFAQSGAATAILVINDSQGES